MTTVNNIDFIGEFAIVELVDGYMIKGECFTVDPVTGTFIFIVENDNQFEAKLIMSHAAKTIVKDNKPPDALLTEKYQTFKKTLVDKIYGKTDRSNTESTAKRKDVLIKWLEKNHLKVTVTNNEVLSVVNGVATIEPPYTMDCCRSTNTIVLDKIMKMIKFCPDLENV